MSTAGHNSGCRRQCDDGDRELQPLLVDGHSAGRGPNISLCSLVVLPVTAAARLPLLSKSKRGRSEGGTDQTPAPRHSLSRPLSLPSLPDSLSENDAITGGGVGVVGRRVVYEEEEELLDNPADAAAYSPSLSPPRNPPSLLLAGRSIYMYGRYHAPSLPSYVAGVNPPSLPS